MVNKETMSSLAVSIKGYKILEVILYTPLTVHGTTY